MNNSSCCGRAENRPSSGDSSCACSSPASSPAASPRALRLRFLRLALVVAAAAFLYPNLDTLANALTYDVLGVARGSLLGEALAFFFYDTPKVLLLLMGVVYTMGLVQSAFTPERTRRFLAGRNAATSHGLAVLLGVVTPFCSCSSVPLFIGFVTSGVPLGVTFTFLLASPLVSEIMVVLLFALFGWKVAGLYLVTGATIAMLAGLIIDRLKMERHVEGWVREIVASQEDDSPAESGWSARLDYAAKALREVLGRVWPFLVGGIAIGAGIHGYMPADALASVMGRDAWWSVPAAVLIGIPLYSDPAGVVPVMQALLGKGAALGTTMAFMMATIALSLPELLMLRKVLKPRLIATFVGIVATGILLVGYLFNAVL